MTCISTSKPIWTTWRTYAIGITAIVCLSGCAIRIEPSLDWTNQDNWLTRQIFGDGTMTPKTKSTRSITFERGSADVLVMLIGSILGWCMLIGMFNFVKDVIL